MTKRLEPNIDIYGGKARRSAIADFAELWALRGYRPTVSLVSDYVEANEWTQKLRELYINASPDLVRVEQDLENTDLPAEDFQAGEQVFDVLRERQATLGDLYPFEIIDGVRLVQRSDVDGAVYIALHHLTIAHAYDVSASQDPTNVFEESTRTYLSDVGFSAINFTTARAGRTFEEAVIYAGQEINLPVTPEVGIRSRYATDENVDIIGHFDLRDGRHARLVMIGQVTCAKSDDWDLKLQEPSVAFWRDLLGLSIPPVVFLSIPHHSESVYFAKLVGDRERFVLDRLTMCLGRVDVIPGEAAIRLAVEAVSVAAP